MLIETKCSPLKKARSVNQTSSSFVDKLSTASEPNGDAGTATGATVFDIAGQAGAYVPNSVLVLPYGVGSGTFSMQLWGWDHTLGSSSTNRLWVPTLLAEVLCTLDSGLPGIAGADVVNTELFCDALTVTYGNLNVSVDPMSPGATKRMAHVVADLKGCKKLEIAFSTGGGATSCNALWRLI